MIASGLPNVIRSVCWNLFNFCGEEASMTVKLGSKRGMSVTNVETIEFLENIFKRAIQRNDEFGQTVSTRVQSCIDLIAVEAIYDCECR